MADKIIIKLLKREFNSDFLQIFRLMWNINIYYPVQFREDWIQILELANVSVILTLKSPLTRPK